MEEVTQGFEKQTEEKFASLLLDTAEKTSTKLTALTTELDELIGNITGKTLINTKGIDDGLISVEQQSPCWAHKMRDVTEEIYNDVSRLEAIIDNLKSFI